MKGGNKISPRHHRRFVRQAKKNEPSPFFRPVIQPKLTINQPKDIYEQEADAVAEKVMRMPDPKAEATFFQPKPIPLSSLQRKCSHCEEEEKVQLKGEAIAGGGMSAPSSVQDVINSGGQSLDRSTRNFMEPRFGYDFGRVQIHNDPFAHQSSKEINALAYTHGNHVVFGSGQYQPDTNSGRQLLAHELAHVVQQNGSFLRIQKAEDWDFTPADYDALLKKKKDLVFGPDSAWVPQKLKDNILATLKFALTAKKPARTGGINVKDFYHGHLAVPEKAATKKLEASISGFNKASEDLETKGKGGSAGDVTTSNLGTFSKAMVAIEKLATPLVNEALKIKGATVIYHTFEWSGPSGMKVGDPTRNIKTDIGGSPTGYSPPDIDNASSYTDDFRPVLQFAFLVDEKGVIHVTVGTVPNLSRVTGTPLSIF
jgi:hypothetical protein